MRLLAALFLLVIGLPAVARATGPVAAGDRPNVVLILIDDQGYGDIAALGNPVVKTPALDRLHGESVRFTDYHVDPTCSPTRASLLTGRYSTRTGVWHTINGRSLMAPAEYTLAELFRDNGYRTGIFGKWHLGANAPLRPRDQGFDTAVWSPGGAVNQGANWFGNDCFDDTFKVNDRWQAFEGYHTDVWFEQARAFIEAGQAQGGGKPFFVYLPTTAAHEPWNVPENYARPYREAGVPPEIANFYGMVTNIDENVGRLRAWLADRGLADNTIFIFTTDNGTGLGWSGDAKDYPYFNAGMRGWKSSEYDGGHRVPLFIHWPAGGVAKGRDVDTLAGHIDLLPTLVELCGLTPIDPARLPRGPLDGRSLAADIQGRDGGSGPTGVRFVHSQRIADPVKWRDCAVMTDRWRLVNGAELYDIEADPGQQTDLAATQPDVVSQLRADYEAWWASLEPVFAEHVRFDLGGAENPTTLMSHDWLMPGTKPSAWHQQHVRDNRLINGPFMVRVAKAGRYRITPLRWPEYLVGPGGPWTGRIAIDSGGTVIEAEIPRGAGTPAGAVEVTLPAGPATLTTTLTRGDGATFGGYYVTVERLDEGERQPISGTGAVSAAWRKDGNGASTHASAATVLAEAESFADLGGWSLDTQFIREMGSPYLLAHGLGTPVQDATTKVAFREAGTYHAWVRTKDWVARWKAPGAPGRFQVLVNGKPLAETFGTAGAEWGWQAGGSVTVPAGETTIALHDLTGFDGRCDCIAFTTAASPPPNDSAILAAWRRESLRLPDEPETKGPYDLVVVGGGYSGMGAAIAAARMGLTVALIQDRPVLGGNGSSEVRVWAMGLVKRGKYPHIGEIVEEFADKAKKSPGTYEEFGDVLKEKVVRDEPNIDLFLNTHAFAVARDGQRITGVTCLDTKTSRELAFTGTFFCDATGHATIGHLAGAETVMEPKGRMGMSNMWAWDERETPQAFPETPWALPLAMADFPYPRDHHGQWFWESGFDKDPLGDAEAIRDWNLRAVFGAFNAMKNGDGAAKHATAVLTWVAYVGGPRESRRILGDVVLTQDDIVSKREFPDGCVPSTWSIDLHYPKQEFAKKFPDNPFISIAVHDKRVDRTFGYPVPYRCFYSKDVANLFMAGRCISVTHEALGTVRVMKTCGMMGEVVGKAASVAKKHGTTPRGVYEKHWSELDELLQLPGNARRPGR